MGKFSALCMCIFLMVGVTLATSFFAFGDLLKKELFFSWFLNLFNAYLSASICKIAVGKGLNAFLAWSLLGGGLRFLTVLSAVGYVIYVDWGNQLALITFILSGYLIFMVGEIVFLLRLSK